MSLRTTISRLAIMLVAAGLLPMGAATVQEDDAITRTFSIRVIGEIHVEGGGTGIYTPTTPCPVAIFGTRPYVPTPIYYMDQRQTYNGEPLGRQLFGGETIPIPILACPIPGSGGDVPMEAAVGKTNFWGPYDGVVIDQNVCGKGDVGGVVCFPRKALSTATLAYCPLEDATFMTSPYDEKSVFENLAGSRAITCNDGFNYSITYYDSVPIAPPPYCEGWFFEDGIWGTDFCVIQVADLVPPGDGLDDTGYLVTCMYTSAVVIPQNGEPAYSQEFRSHDYILVLDRDGTPASHEAALLKHEGGTNPKQGYHDLGGQNGFPCPPRSIFDTPPDARAEPPHII